MTYHSLVRTGHRRVLSPLSSRAARSPHSQVVQLELEEKIPGFSLAVVFPGSPGTPQDKILHGGVCCEHRKRSLLPKSSGSKQARPGMCPLSQLSGSNHVCQGLGGKGCWEMDWDCWDVCPFPGQGAVPRQGLEHREFPEPAQV